MEITGHGRGVGQVHIISSARDQFTPNIVLYLNLCRYMNRWVSKIPDRSDRRGQWVYTRTLPSPAQTSESVNMPNSLLKYAISAPEMIKGESRKLRDCPFYYTGSLVLIYRFDTSFYTLTAAAGQVTEQILHGVSNVF